MACTPDAERHDIFVGDEQPLVYEHAADTGRTCRIPIQDHASRRVRRGRANQFGTAQSQPLIAFAADKNPVSVPIIAMAGDEAAVTMLKSTADGKALIVRLRSFSKNDARVALSWPARHPRSVTICERGEERGKTEAGNQVTVPAMGFVWLRAEW